MPFPPPIGWDTRSRQQEFRFVPGVFSLFFPGFPVKKRCKRSDSPPASHGKRGNPAGKRVPLLTNEPATAESYKTSVYR